jgi:hypothetical protein
VDAVQDFLGRRVFKQPIPHDAEEVSLFDAFVAVGDPGGCHGDIVPAGICTGSAG